jgi:MFS family permease
MQITSKNRKKQAIPNHHKFSPDFNSVIFIVLWNSLGFFFIEFSMNYYIRYILNYPPYNVGLFFSFITLGGLTSSSFIGFLTDRYSKRILVMIGSFGRGISYFGLYISVIAESLIGMYVSAFVLGLGANIFWNPLDTIISEKSSKYHRSSAFGKRRFALGIGMLIGTVLGFVIFALADAITPGNAFFLYGAIPIFGIANFIAGIQFSRKVDEKKKFIYPEDNPNSLIELELENSKITTKKSPNSFFVLGIIILLSGFFLTAINSGFYRPYIQLYVLDFINPDPVSVAIFYFPATLLGAIIAPKLGTLADRVNTYYAVTVASILGGVVTWLIIHSGNLWFFAFLLVIDNTIMLTVSFVFINFLSRVSNKHRGKLFSVITLFESIGNIIGPFFGGIIYYVNPQAPFIISIIVEWSLISFFILGMKILNPYLVESKEIKKKN